MKLFLKVILSIVIVIIVIIAGSFIYLTRGMEAIGEVNINGVNPSSLDDGIYTGKYDAGRWSNELKVTIKNHRISKIDIVQDVTFSLQEVSEELFSKVIKEQNTTVDAVSEATITSKAYLKAIENALNK